MQKVQAAFFLSCFCLMVLGAGTRFTLASEEDEAFRESVRAAELIFKGHVLSVEYRNSKPTPLLDPNTHEPVIDPNTGEPILVDGSDLPHTFVTYRIDRIYKGKVPIGSPDPCNVTLRVQGGLYMPHDPNNPEILWVSDTPHFDVGDRDVLLAKGNTSAICPLAGWADGRFRIVTDPNDSIVKVYGEDGQRILRWETDDPNLPATARMGPYQDLPSVNYYRVGPYGFTRVHSEHQGETAESEYSGEGHFTEGQFGTFLVSYIQAVHTPEELAAVPPIRSADITKPFAAPALRPAEEDPAAEEAPRQMERPWLDELSAEAKRAILEQEDEEARLLTLTGGNPVLPKTTAELKRLRFGGPPADLNGPSGKPDLKIDLLDFASFAESWLESYDTESED